MEKFITEVIGPIFSQPPLEDQAYIQQRLSTLLAELQILTSTQVKIETSHVNKELAKKSRELFILSSDNESLKQTISAFQQSQQQLKSQLALLEQQKTKQKLVLQRQIAQAKKQSELKQKQLKAQIAKIKNEKELQAEQNAQKTRQLKRQHQKQMAEAIEAENQRFQEQKAALMEEFEQQKTHIINDSNEKKKQLIKKYEDKVNKLTDDYENKIYTLEKKINDDHKENSKLKGNMQDKIVKLENEVSRLKSELNMETNFHKKFENEYKTTNQSYIEFQQEAAETKEKLEQEIHELKKKLYQEQRKYIKDTTNLNKILEQTILEKDSKFNETVETMSIEHRIQVDSLRNQMMEERQIAVNAVEVQREQQSYNNQIKYNELNDQYQSLKVKYERVNEDYRQQIEEMTTQNEDFIQALNSRKEYELQVNDKNAERELREIKLMYELKIKSIHEKQAQEMIELQKKFNEQKIGLGNKLTTQYQSMISDIRNSNEIQIKQKLIEFERKAKGYEGKIKDSDKKKAEIKAQMERVKMEMQMRVDSMIQVTETLEEQITDLNEKIKDLERQNQRIVNDYELKLLLLRNQMKQQADQHQIHEEQLKELLESKLKAKNEEIILMTSKLNRETKQLINRNQQRVRTLQKEYNELKRVLGQKTSLPQDIQALKVFHRAYLEREQELEKQKKKVEYLRRELMAKDAIDKVFAEKGEKIIFEVDGQSVNPYKTYQNFSSKKQRTPLFGAFKSAQIF